MLDSCQKMSESLVDYFDDDGKRSKSSSRSERKFKQDITDFFTQAKCLDFDKEIEVGCYVELEGGGR